MAQGIISYPGSEEGVVRTDINEVKATIQGLKDKAFDANYALQIFTDDKFEKQRAAAVRSIIDGNTAGLDDLLKTMKTPTFGRELVEPQFRLYAAVENLAREVNFTGNLAEILAKETKVTYDLRSEDPFLSLQCLGQVADGAKTVIGNLKGEIRTISDEYARFRAQNTATDADLADARAETARVRAERELYKGFADPFYGDYVLIATTFGWVQTGATADRIKVAQKQRDTFLARQETPVVLMTDIAKADADKLVKVDDISMIALAQDATRRKAFLGKLVTPEAIVYATAYLDLAAKYGGVVQEFEDLVNK